MVSTIEGCLRGGYLLVPWFVQNILSPVQSRSIHCSADRRMSAVCGSRFPLVNVGGDVDIHREVYDSDNKKMHPSGEVGHFQMDNLSSPPGDFRRSAQSSLAACCAFLGEYVETP